jgi:capsular polysaccharide biosynthesis protein
MEFELKDLLAPLRKWWWLVLIATLVAGVSSYFAASQQPDKYRSSATLIVGSALFLENPTAQDINISQQLTDFYVVMRIVVRRVMRPNKLCKYNVDVILSGLKFWYFAPVI